MRIHPRDGLLQEFAAGTLEDQEALLEHLVTCVDCRRRLHLLLPTQPQTGGQVIDISRRPADYDRILKGASTYLHSLETAYAKERMEARLLITELLEHPAERQRLLVRNSSRFQTWGLCELLLKRSREQNFQNATLGESLALLALEILDHLDEAYYGAEPLEDLKARSWAYIANSRRIQSDFRGAEEGFALAYSALERGTGEPLEKAVVLDLRSSLLRSQRRFEEALRLLRRAIRIFRDIGERHRAGRSLVNMSIVHHFAGHPDKAIPFLNEALELIDAKREPRLLLVAWHNLIDNLTETGQFMEAQKLLARANPSYQQHPQPRFQNPRMWVKGKIARGLGQRQLAETLLLKARDGFLEEGVPYDVALVSLDLASLYAEQGRFQELKRLAEEMVSIFSSRQIHREALAALAFWKQAVEAEQDCSSLVTRVASFLKKARHDPGLRFQDATG